VSKKFKVAGNQTLSVSALTVVSLKKEAEHYGMTELEKRDKDCQFGKFVKKPKKN
jgi:hypothetical protein